MGAAAVCVCVSVCKGRVGLRVGVGMGVWLGLRVCGCGKWAWVWVWRWRWRVGVWAGARPGRPCRARAHRVVRAHACLVCTRALHAHTHTHMRSPLHTTTHTHAHTCTQAWLLTWWRPRSASTRAVSASTSSRVGGEGWGGGWEVEGVGDRSPDWGQEAGRRRAGAGRQRGRGGDGRREAQGGSREARMGRLQKSRLCGLRAGGGRQEGPG